MRAENNSILIAGMGVTGRAVAHYFDSQSIDYVACDDSADSAMPPCTNDVPGASGYVVKSPGIVNQLFSKLLPQGHLVNDIEVFMRICNKPVMLVTGTNGKSTVVALLERILSACGINAVACGNYGLPILDAYTAGAGADVYVIELSSYQLENMATLRSISSVVLNIANDHLDRYKDMTEYLSVKEGIYENAGVKVVPVDRDGNLAYGSDMCGFQYTGSRGSGLYSVDEEGISRDGVLYIPSNKVQLQGAHNYLNVCASLSLCHVLDLDDDKVKQAVESFSGLEHRMELCFTDALNRSWVNDSKSTNVHSLEAAISSCDGKICLLMGGQGKDETYAEFFKKHSSHIEHLVLFGRDAELIGQQAGKTVKQSRVSTVEQAVAVAREVSGEGGVVLFSPACSSFDQYENYKTRGDDFKAQVRCNSHDG